MSKSKNKQPVSQPISVKAHADWFKGKMGVLSSNTDQGIIKLQKGVFSFTDLNGKVELELSASQIKKVTTANNKGTAYRNTFHVLTNAPQPQPLFFGIYKDKQQGEGDTRKLRDWRKAFRQNGIKATSYQLYAQVVILIALAVFVVYVILKK